MKPVSVIFSRERTVNGEKIAIGFQADITENETPDEALNNVQSLVEQKLSVFAPSAEELARQVEEEKRQERIREFEARKAELEAEYGDVASAPIVEEKHDGEAPVAEETAVTETPTEAVAETPEAPAETPA